MHSEAVHCIGIGIGLRCIKIDIYSIAIYVYVVPTGMEEAPKATLNIHCLQRGGGAALTRMINLIPPPRGDGCARALTA